MKRMWITVAITLTTGGMIANASQSGLVAYDGFGGGARNDLNGLNGGAGWSSAWKDVGSYPTRVVDAGLTYPNLPTTPGAALTDPQQYYSDISDYDRATSSYDAPDGKLYVSFLLRPEANYGTFAGLRFGRWPKAVLVGSPPGYYAYGMMIGDAIIDTTNIPEVEGEVAFLVLEIVKYKSPLKNVYRLFVNPTVGDGQPKYADLEMAMANQSWLPTSLELFNDGGMTTDEIRVGLSWGDVVPTICRGDANCDRNIDFNDIDAFVVALADPSSVCNFENCDVDADGSINFNDIDPFVDAIINGASCK